MLVSLEIALDLLIYLLAIFTSKKGLCYKYNNTNTVWFLALCFCLFAAWGGDYFHYQEHFVFIKTGADSHMEAPYFFIIKYLSPFYFVFRLIVWGGALYMFRKTVNVSNIPENYAVYVFVALSLPRFSYARASLAMAIMYLGGVILASSKPKQLKRILFGLALVFVSVYFHKSAVFGIAVIVISLFARKLISKPLIIALFAVFPFVLFFLKDFLVDYMLVESFEESMINISSGQRYLSGEISGGVAPGIATRIENGLMKLSFYLASFLFIITVFKNKYQQLPENIKFISCCAFFTTFLASLFAFDTGFDTLTLYNRFLLFTSLPSCLFVSYLIKEKVFVSISRLTVVIAIAASIFAILYSLYCSIVT